MSKLRRILLFLTLLFLRPFLTTEAQVRTNGWAVNEKRDAFTGEQIRDAKLTVPADLDGRHIGSAYVTATCGEGSSWLSLEITFQSSNEKDLGFESSRLSPSAFTNFLVFAAVKDLSVTQFRVKIDDQASTSYSRRKYSNSLSLDFFDGWSESDIVGPPIGRNRFPPVGPLSQGFSAKHIMVELPLANSQRPLVKINLEDRNYLSFISKCDGYEAAVTPPPPPPPVRPPDYLGNARRHMANHEFHAAIADYEQVLANDPQNAEANQGIAAIQDVVPKRQIAFVESLGPKGIWLDGVTKLMWTMSDSDKEFYNDGSLYCSNLHTGGLTGWRLPSIPEMQKIYDPKSPTHNKAGIELRGNRATVSAYSGNQDCDTFSFQTGSYHQFFNFQCSQVYVRAICVRPYQMDVDGVGNPLQPLPPIADTSSTPPSLPVTPRTNAPFVDPVFDAFKRAHDQGDEPPPPRPSSDPATSYYERGTYLLGQSLVDPKTGKIQLAPGCAEAFKKYLAVAPNGQHAEEVRGLIRTLGIH